MQTKYDLVVTSTESVKEKFFVQKCNSLLNVCGAFLLTNYAMDPVMFKSTFTNSIVSEKEINFILLKKYYLTIQKETLYSSAIRKLINERKFSEIESLIEEDPIIRGILMENYIENIDENNHDAAIKRIVLTDYDEMNNVLLAMKCFYSYEKQEEQKHLSLKSN